MGKFVEVNAPGEISQLPGVDQQGQLPEPQG